MKSAINVGAGGRELELSLANSGYVRCLSGAENSQEEGYECHCTDLKERHERPISIAEAGSETDCWSNSLSEVSKFILTTYERDLRQGQEIAPQLNAC